MENAASVCIVGCHLFKLHITGYSGRFGFLNEKGEMTNLSSLLFIFINNIIKCLVCGTPEPFRDIAYEVGLQQDLNRIHRVYS